jgi:hypothetical protein
MTERDFRAFIEYAHIEIEANAVERSYRAAVGGGNVVLARLSETWEREIGAIRRVNLESLLRKTTWSA